MVLFMLECMALLAISNVLLRSNISQFSSIFEILKLCYVSNIQPLTETRLTWFWEVKKTLKMPQKGPTQKSIYLLIHISIFISIFQCITTQYFSIYSIQSSKQLKTLSQVRAYSDPINLFNSQLTQPQDTLRN